jgi:hypothetical protein
MIRTVLAAAVLWLAFLPLRGVAADYYVDNVKGDDHFDGLRKEAGPGGAGPFRTISRGLKAASAGDTVHLNPTGELYRETADFYGHKGGEPGKPLTLDGHGATLCGSDPCTPDGWTEWQGGVLKRDDMVSQCFMLVDGEMVFGEIEFNMLTPGEFCVLPAFDGRLYFYPPAGKQATDCKVEVTDADGTAVTLDPAKWQGSGSRIGAVRRCPVAGKPQAVKLDGQQVPLVTAKERLKPSAWSLEGKTVYFRPPAGKNVKDLKIEFSTRTNAVQLGGETAHVVIRNLNVCYVFDDGYNIHGHVTDCAFYNCNAHHCGDQAFSAHDACETVVDGAVYDLCCMGVANVNTKGYSVTRNVTILNSRSFGFLIQTDGRPIEDVHHELSNAVLVNNPTQVSASNLKMDNVLLAVTPSYPPRYGYPIGGGEHVEALRTTIAYGVLRTGTAEVKVADSVLACGFHVRADDPLAVLKLSNVTFGQDGVVEWGSQPPWKRRPIAEWLGDASAAGAARDCRMADLGWVQKVMKDRRLEQLPAGVGCSAEVWQRFFDAAGTREDLR